MARVHGLPGVYPSGEASRRLDRVLVLVLGGSMLLAGVAGFAFGRYGLAAGAAFTVLAAVFAVVGDRALTSRVKQAAARRRNYASGAEGEQLVAEILTGLPDDWHIFHGIMLSPRKDLDHVVVGPGGVYYIATKNLRGLFSRDESDALLYNNKRTPIGQQVLRDTMAFRDRLSTALGLNRYVNAVLAAPFAYVDLPAIHKNVSVLHRDNLRRTLETAPKRLDRRQVDACVEALELLSKAGKDVRLAAARARFTDRPNASESPAGDESGRA